jgi:uncharacterized protein (TIGR02466 family)
MIVQEIFPTPIYINHIGFLNDDETKFINSLKTRKNNLSGNACSLNTYVLNSMPELSNKILIQLNTYLKTILSPKSEVSLKITQSWVNFNENNTAHHTHNHVNSIISGVYYINPEIPQSIKFFKKHENILSYEIDYHNQFNSKEFMLNCKRGMLILFPSELTHAVEPNESLEKRISLSFNTFFKGSFGIKEAMSFLDLE